MYAHHDGQSSWYSVYGPVEVFRIRDIMQNNLNPLAKYWHVFNFVKNSQDDYEIKKIPVTDAGGNPAVDEYGNSEYDNGWLNTNFCQVLNDIPGVPDKNKCSI